MKEKEITVLKVEPGKSPETVTMPNTLDAMQKMVGGYIEVPPRAMFAWSAMRTANCWGWKETGA